MKKIKNYTDFQPEKINFGKFEKFAQNEIKRCDPLETISLRMETMFK